MKIECSEKLKGEVISLRLGVLKDAERGMDKIQAGRILHRE